MSTGVESSTIPGVNLICAASFMAAIGDVNRLITSRKLVA